MTISVSEMLNDLSGKPRWTVAQDYHPHIVSVSHYVHRSNPAFTVFDKRVIRLPDRRK